MPKLICRSSEQKKEKALHILRQIARDHQGSEPCVFYPLREVAHDFSLSISAVDRIYRDLEDEGLISRIRGSQTILQGKAASRRLKVRGFIAIPVSLSKFIISEEYRAFLINLRREFWQKGFVVSNVFYNIHEDDPEALAQRIRHRGVDTVVWHMPDRIARETSLLLSDKGIRVIGIADGDETFVQPSMHICRAKALRAILDEWKQTVRRIRIFLGPGDFIFKEIDLKRVCDECVIPFEIVELPATLSGKLTNPLTSKDTTGFVLLANAATLLASRIPEKLRALMDRERVALLEGPVVAPFAELRESEVDLVMVDWKELTEFLVRNLIASQDTRLTRRVFHAQAKLRVPLFQFSQNL